MADITVSNFAELRAAILDSTSTNIFLTSNINFSGGGIIVPRTKGNITIDGQGYIINDYNSASYTDTIWVQAISGPDITITVKNVTWNGANYYGIICVYDSTLTSNVTVIYNNINYTGVQPAFNRYGTTKITDCNITISMVGSASVINEVGEFGPLYLGGNTNIVSNIASGSVYSMFFFPNSSGSFNVEENANISITAVNNYVFYSDSEPPATFGANSKTTITSARGLFLYNGATNHMFSSFTLGAGASFSAYTGRTSSAYGILRCRNNFIVEEGSTFYLETKTSGTGPSLYFPAVANNIRFNNPKSVVVYNNGGNVFNFNAGTSTNNNIVYMQAQQINYWNTAAAFPAAGTFEDLPTRQFMKISLNNIEATIRTTSSAMYSVVSNMESGDIGYDMTTTTFPMLSCSVLSMGNIEINLNSIYDISTKITGTTEEYANLKANYLSTELSGTSSASGEIEMQIPLTIPIQTIVTFGVNWKFLFRYVLAEVVGSLRITHLPDLVFKTWVAPLHREIVKRANANWYVEVTDTRIPNDSPNWYLYVSLPTPLTTGTNDLDNALILRENSTDTLITPTFVLVKQGEWSNPPPIVTHVSWQEIEGFLLRVDPEFYYNAGQYVSQMQWFITTDLQNPTTDIN